MWTYQGKVVDSENLPPKAFGFIYLITHVPTGKKYIGRKLLTKAHTRQKAGKKIKSRVESDWKDYWSSSPLIAEMIEQEGGTHNFTREILVFAAGKGHLNYLEEKFQYCLGCIESDEWLNSNIRSKQFKRHIMGKIDIAEINSVISRLQQ